MTTPPPQPPDSAPSARNKHIRYLGYVLRHKWFVFRECCRFGIPWQGVVHDLSKFRPDEWLPYAEYFYGGDISIPVGVHSSVAQSVREWEQGYRERDFDKAWLLHQHRNPHHWQYWVLREDDGGTKALPMPDHYRREMLADWIGAGLAMGKPDTGAWYRENAGRMVLHPETRRWIEVALATEAAS